METFKDTADLLSHAENHHGFSTESMSLKSVVLSAASVTLLNPTGNLKCPLCQQDDWSSHHGYATHVGKHLEEIALCALPPNTDDDENDEEGDLFSSSDDDASPQEHDIQNPPLGSEVYRSEFTTNSLGPDGDEYIPLEYDGRKVDIFGCLQRGRSYAVTTFTLPGRGQKLFMLATECASHLRYSDTNLLFSENGSLFKIDVTSNEVQHLINCQILPRSYKAQSVAVITARSVFRQFGCNVVQNGRPVVDDYWDSQNSNSYELSWRRPPKILMVEDDPTCRQIVKKFLYTFYCQVHCAEDGLEAVNKVQEGVKYDMILMDIIMPNLDGVSATHIIRQFDKTTIIAMTSNIRSDDIQMYFHHGMDDLLPKPFSRKSLLDMLNKHLMHLKVPEPELPPEIPQLSAVTPYKPSVVAPASSAEDFHDPIVLSVIELLKRSGNRPHSVEDMVPILVTTNAELRNSMVPELVLRIHINRYLARSWTNANPCPLSQQFGPGDQDGPPLYLMTQSRHGDPGEKRDSSTTRKPEQKDTLSTKDKVSSPEFKLVDGVLGPGPGEKEPRRNRGFQGLYQRYKKKLPDNSTTFR